MSARGGNDRLSATSFEAEAHAVSGVGVRQLETSFLGRSDVSPYPDGVYWAMLDQTSSDLRCGSGKVSTVMAAYGQITRGHWPAMLMGVVLLLTVVATTTAVIMRRYRPRRKETVREPTARLSDPVPSEMDASLSRCWA